MSQTINPAQPAAAPHPDLLVPYLPDADDLHRSPTTSPSHISVERGGTSLRGDIDWPESGPSSLPMTNPSSSSVESKPKIGPFGAKVVAAMTGATVTSLLMTPFDVLKTRLQTVQPQPLSSTLAVNPIPRASTECCQTSLLTPLPSSRRLGKTKQPAQNPLTCFTSTSPDDLPSSSRTTKPAIGAGVGRAAYSSLTVPAEAPRGCAHPSKWAGIWGEAVSYEEAISRNRVMRMGNGNGNGAGEGFATLVLPQQGEVIPRGAGGFWGEVAAVRAEVGIRGLWKGVGTALTMSIPSAAIYMIGYEHLLTRLSPYFITSSDPSAHISSIHRQPGSPSSAGSASFTAAPLVAGALARTLSATTISPIEMFRTRLQALPSHGVSPSYASVLGDMRGLVKAESVAVLWRGLGPTLWRDVPFSGIYWAGFEILKTNLSSSPSTTSFSPLTVSFLSGAISGTISALVTQPFDVLKTRRQVFTPSPDCSPAALRHRASTLPLAMHVIKTEGCGALFAGTVPRCGKVAPACGLMIACYEGVGRYLGGSK